MAKFIPIKKLCITITEQRLGEDMLKLTRLGLVQFLWRAVEFYGSCVFMSATLMQTLKKAFLQLTKIIRRPLTEYFGECLSSTLQPHRYPGIYLDIFYLQSHHMRWQQSGWRAEKERERKRESCCNAGADNTSGFISAYALAFFLCLSHQFGLYTVSKPNYLFLS